MLLPTVVILGRLYYYIKRLSNEMTTYEEWKQEMEQNPYDEEVMGRSISKNEYEKIRRANETTKTAKKRENDKKEAFSSNYGYTNLYMSDEEAENKKIKLTARQLITEKLKRIRVKPTSEAEDLDLPSPRPARKKGDPNIAFKKKQYDDRIDIIHNKKLKRDSEKPQSNDELDVLVEDHGYDEDNDWNDHMIEYD
jgi:hypothetical protein